MGFFARLIIARSSQHGISIYLDIGRFDVSRLLMPTPHSRIVV